MKKDKKTDCSIDVVNTIKQVLDDFRPYLNLEGGDVQFVKYEDGYVYVKLQGACANCIAQDETLNNGILYLIQEKVPEVKGIINVLL